MGGSGGTAAPLTLGALSAAGSAVGAKYAAAGAALDHLDSLFSGPDDLIMQVNGETVLPVSGVYEAMEAGQTKRLSIKVPFQGHARIALVEYDSGSDNDDLGHLDVQGGMSYSVDQAFILAPNAEDGSVYLVSYRVKAGEGNPADVVGFMLCGTNQCEACINPRCVHQPYDNLDRDKDW